MSKRRKYSETYLQFGFTFVVNNGMDIPVCVLCQKTLGNDSLKPSLLTRHLERAHPEFKDKDLNFFKRKEEVLKKQRLDPSGRIFQQNSAVMQASYEVSLMIAKQKKAHTIGKTLFFQLQKQWCVVSLEMNQKKSSTLSPCQTIQCNDE